MTPQQITDHLLMVRPAAFGSNPETAASNAFQCNEEVDASERIQAAAIAEFDAAVEKIREADVHVKVIEDSRQPSKPDAVFPNNWLSTHEPGVVVTYPMYSPIRRQEIRAHVISELRESFHIDVILPLESLVNEERYLEGTGSLILDRVNKMAFACRSPRTVESAMDEFCRQLDYQKVLFDAVDSDGTAIYHTNVMMTLTEKQVVICLDSIGAADRNRVLENLAKIDRKVVTISMQQMMRFAGNMLQVRSANHNRLMLMSATAMRSLDASTKDAIAEESQIIELEIPTIEKYGGGSVRCMLAEIFLEPRK